MDTALIGVAERLAREFARLPNSTIVRVLTDSVDANCDADAMFVEQAARARLSELAELGTPDG
jgi:hypothetical protein